MVFYNNFIIANRVPDFTGYDAGKWNVSVENKIISNWKLARFKNKLILIFTLGIGYLFLNKLTSYDELKSRIGLFEKTAEKMNKAARTIQLAFAKKVFSGPRSISEKIVPHTKSQISSSIMGLSMQFLYSSIRSGELDLLNPKGQILWQNMLHCREILKGEKNSYVFTHAHSLPIGLHLGLASHFQSMHQSKKFLGLKPLANRTMFRARKVAKYYNNTTDYFKSPIGKSINSGHSMDDNHRETIISCDGIPNNNEPFESARHFLNSNKSIVDTKSSTGVSHANFDRKFIASYLSDPYLQQHAVAQFQKARNRLKKLSDYGMLRLIVIPKKQLKNPKTNYVWRSHAFGVACKCQHTRGLQGHREFIATLKSHQKGDYIPCKKKSNSFQSHLPQYRILAENLDRDHKKQVYTMSCLNKEEEELYNDTFERLKKDLSVLVNLEKLHLCKDYSSLLDVLKSLELDNPSFLYQRGVKQLLKTHAQVLSLYAKQLRHDLNPSHWVFLFIKT